MTLDFALASAASDTDMLPVWPSQSGFSATRLCLTRDGHPWLPIMGEFHFSRYSPSEWLPELEKMKAGGVTLVSTYLFWNHHEPQPGLWRFDGRFDISAFLHCCEESGLLAIVRLGPWCHGESRYGGFPDWLEALNIPTRCSSGPYWHYIEKLYQAYAEQLQAHLYGNGGCVIGVQLENEMPDNAEYLFALKKLALSCGITVPYYTVTGWGAHITKFPHGEMLPVFGGYPDAPWEQHTHAMPPNPHYFFVASRNDSTIGNDQLRGIPQRDEQELQNLPYLCCELGPGVQVTHHRRPTIEPNDVAAMIITAIGSGSNLPGYYMYHGGYNPPNGLYQESTDTGYPNDVPVSSYDFQAPIGEYGQLRPVWSRLRPLHRFLQAEGQRLAAMPAFFPVQVPSSTEDLTTPRAAIRTRGEGGYVFYNSWQRGSRFVGCEDLQFSVSSQNGHFVFPRQPLHIPSGSYGVFPFQMSFGGIRVEYITAMPLWMRTVNEETYCFLMKQDGVRVCMAVSQEIVVETDSPAQKDDNGLQYFPELCAGHHICATLRSATEKKCVHLIVLTCEDAQQLNLIQTPQGEMLVLCATPLLQEKAEAPALLLSTECETMRCFPPVPEFYSLPQKATDGIFSVHELTTPPFPPAPDISLQPTQLMLRQENIFARYLFAPVSQCPEFLLCVPPNALDDLQEIYLRFSVAADVVQLYDGDTLLADEFLYRPVWEIGLSRFRAQIKARHSLRIKCSPLSPTQKIYFDCLMPRDVVQISLAEVTMVRRIQLS